MTCNGLSINCTRLLVALLIVSPIAPGQSSEKNEAQEISDLRNAAERGDAKSQFELGLRYELGIEVKQDFAEAARWYRKAAEQGDEAAENSLGYMF